MSESSADITAVLDAASDADLARVHINGQTWIRETALTKAAGELLKSLQELYRLRGLSCDLEDEASLRARATIRKAKGAP